MTTRSGERRGPQLDPAPIMTVDTLLSTLRAAAASLPQVSAPEGVVSSEAHADEARAERVFDA